MYRYMPLTLLVDEILPDRVRAIVSHPGSITANILALIKVGLIPTPLEESINGLFICATGKYVCLIVKATHNHRMADGMVFLDLTDRADVIDEIGQKLGTPALQKKFFETVDYIFANPDTHSRFLLSINQHDVMGT